MTAPIVRAPIGNQNAAGEPGLGSSPRANIEKGANSRRVGLRVEMEKAMRERPRLSLELGGSAPDFVTELPDTEYTIEGKRFHYTPHVFHVLNAIMTGLLLCILSIWMLASWLPAHASQRSRSRAVSPCSAARSPAPTSS